jgi:hypothetical protein
MPRIAATFVASCAIAVSAVGANEDVAVTPTVGRDAGVTVGLGAEVLVRHMRLALATLEGEEATVLPAGARRDARATLGERSWVLSAEIVEAGGGQVVDLRADPERGRRSLGAFAASDEVEVSVSALLQDGVRTDVGRSGPTRLVHLTGTGGASYVLQTEVPARVETAGSGEETLLRLARSGARAGSPVAFAVYVGARPYAGPPIILGEPTVSFLEDHGCFEVALRAFGAWDDPFDAGDVSVEAVWRAGGRAGREPGFYAQDFESRTEAGGEPKEPEVLLPLGPPGFRVRLPREAKGGRARVSFATAGGAASAELRIPAIRSRPRRRGRSGMLSGVTLAVPGPRDEAVLARTLALLAGERVPEARLPAFAGAWALSRGPSGEIDLEAAWRIDRTLAAASRGGMRLRVMLPGGGFDERSAFEVTERDLRWLSYASARWAHSDGLAGLELIERGLAARELARGRSGRPPRPGLEVVSHPVVAIASPVSRGLDHLGYRAVPFRLHYPFPTGDTDPARAAFDLARSLDAGSGYVVVHPPSGEGRQAAMWAAALGAGRPVFLGPEVQLEGAAPLVRFLSAEPAIGRLEGTLAFEERSWRLLGRQSAEGALWWVEPRGRREAVPSGYEGEEAPALAPVVQGAGFELEGFSPGVYRVEWWQPREGRLLTKRETRHAGGAFEVACPPFAAEIAGRLVRLRGL